MLNDKYYFWRIPKIKQALDAKNYPAYIFTFIVLAIAWSGVNTIQSNYGLQKKISLLKQQNDVLNLQNQNTNLQNKYYETDQYLDLAARQSLGLAGNGEKILLVPKAIALKYVDKALTSSSTKDSQNKTSSKYIKNLEAWRDFILGRKIHTD